MLSRETQERNIGLIGSVIKAKREEIGMTQKALADLLGLNYYTMISQIERGYVTLPPSMWVPMANALRFDVEHWVLQCLDELHPDTYRALFGRHGQTKVAAALKDLKSS